MFDGKMRGVHRIAYELLVGPIPDGMYVCHHCDNRACWRPDHLFVGTPKDNMQDAHRKGRLKVPRRKPSKPWFSGLLKGLDASV